MNEHINYKGLVKTTLKDKTVVKHNTATKHMFEIILRMLARKTFYFQDTPYYLMMYVVTPEDANDWKNILVNGFKVNESRDVKNIFLDTPEVEVHNSKEFFNRYIELFLNLDYSDLKLNFSANFDKNTLISTNIDSANKYYIALIDGTKTNILAVLEYGSDILNSVVKNDGFGAVVEWTITLSNDNSSET